MTEPADQTQAMAGAQITAQAGERIVLGGRYELTERIASGGMAAVWRAHDDVLARTVAVKLLHDHLAADEDFRERFRREAIAAAKLTHPNVVSLYDTGTDGDRVYLVMEFVDGATLREVITDLGKLEPGQAAALGERIARALDYAHERGLVHRDVKPANILIGDDGSVKVADFGIAKAEEHEGDLTKTGMVLGTAAYVAPEQITGAHPVDGRADQYALGCMIYEALAGRQPFKGDSAVATAAQRLESSPTPLRTLRPDIPRGLDSVIMRAMAREPGDRFVSTGALADALAAFADADTMQTAALPLATLHRAAPRRTGTPPAGFPPPAPPARPESFLRTEGRWLLAVLVMLGVAAAIIGLAMASDLLDPSRLSGGTEPRRSEAPQRPDVARQRIRPDTAVAFDPGGDGRENDEQLPLLFDGSSETAWRTDTYYNDPDFGGLNKEGVGFYMELDGERSLTAADLEIATEGTNVEVLGADEPSEEIADWSPLGQVRDASGQQEIAFDEPTDAQYILVWITPPLPADGSGFRASIAEVTLWATASESER